MSWNYKKIRQYWLSRSVGLTIGPLELAKVLHQLDRQSTKQAAGVWGDRKRAPRAGIGDTVELVDLDDGSVSIFALVDPRDSDPGHGRLSVLSPLGTAVMGLKAGQTAELVLLGRRQRYQLKRISRPRRAQLLDADLTQSRTLGSTSKA